ncbi:DUF4898 domain-containing protein [Saccharolobus solfataricus]
MKSLSPKELETYVDEDLLRVINREQINFIYFINARIISSYEKFFRSFIPDSTKYLVLVSSDLHLKFIKESVIRAKEPLEVSCYVSSKLPPMSFLIIGLKQISEKIVVEKKEVK